MIYWDIAVAWWNLEFTWYLAPGEKTGIFLIQNRGRENKNKELETNFIYILSKLQVMEVHFLNDKSIGTEDWENFVSKLIKRQDYSENTVGDSMDYFNTMKLTVLNSVSDSLSNPICKL